MKVRFLILSCVVWAFTQGGSVRAADLTAGLTAYFPFTANLEDASENALPMRVHGSVALNSEGAYFPGGAEDYLELPFIPLNNRPFAVAMWVKVLAKEPMWGLLYQQESPEENKWLHLMFRGGLQPYLGFYINDAISPVAVRTGEWVHLVFQFTGSHQELWVGGQPVCSREAAPYLGKTGSTFIGRSPDWNNVPSRNFFGSMRELRIYDRAITSEEIHLLSGRSGGISAQGLPNADLSRALAADVGIPFLNIAPDKLFVTGEAGQVYDLLATPDVNEPFQFVASLTNSNGRVEYTDKSGTLGNRFYFLKVRRQ